MGEESVFDILELSVKLLRNLVLILIVILWLGGSLGGLSSDLEVLFSSELSLEDLLHNLLLLGLESLIVQSAAK